MNEMLIALEITALGMGLVFGAIILLWWLMNLLTVLTADRENLPAGDHHASGEPQPPAATLDPRARAAAVAVAIALAEEQASTAHILPDPASVIVSPWQLGTRTRQLYQKGPIRGPRKIG